MAPRRTAQRALRLAALALLIEFLLITPWVDHAAEKNPTVHYTQHGLIFVGGLLMGYALRALSRG
jgi:hypothetical protein